VNPDGENHLNRKCGSDWALNEILIIENAFRNACKAVDNISELAKSLSHWSLLYPEHNFLHPCLIENQATLVCENNLEIKVKQAYAELKIIADQFGLHLKQDSRANNPNNVVNERRSNLCVALTFCLSLLASSRPVSAEDLKNYATHSSIKTNLSMPVNSMEAAWSDQSGAKMIRLRHAKLPKADEVLEAYAEKRSYLVTDDEAEQKIKSFLSAAYQPEAGDPDYIFNDIADMSQYFAQYEQVISLLEELQQKKLVLKYKANTWQAQAFGNDFAVNSVTIYFDTRIGAQLINHEDCLANPACSISPADALLHELLHAKLMLIDSHHFIEIGGMQQHLYPFEHEREVIAKENQLYNAMNGQDGLSRPLRKRHSGELFHVNCAACLPITQSIANEDWMN
jgi:hypothetical protein